MGSNPTGGFTGVDTGWQVTAQGLQDLTVTTLRGQVQQLGTVCAFYIIHQVSPHTSPLLPPVPGSATDFIRDYVQAHTVHSCWTWPRSVVTV